MSSPGSNDIDNPPSGIGSIGKFFKIFETQFLALFDYVTDVNEFQLNIFLSLLGICCANLVFIWIAWRNYGKRISERFMKPASSKIIEDLKKEATELKLPKEHSPRI